jgi:hypothetical protein
MDPGNKVQGRGRETFLGFLLVLFMGGGFLLYLIVISGGVFLYVILAVVVIGLVGYLHYLLWGHSLTEEVAGEREEEEARQRWEEQNAGSGETYPPRNE